MAIKIDKKIKGYAVVRSDEPAPAPAPPVATVAAADAMELPSAEVIQMHERVERPERLEGHTYKIKSPLFEHALYVTINDIVLNEGTEHELRRPYEIFINSKNMEHFQWTVALTRIMSAVFRKGGDVTFLVEELKAVFDQARRLLKAGGVYMPSIVAGSGVVIEDHLRKIGMILGEELSPEQKRLIAEKRAALESRSKKPEPGAGSGAATRRQGQGVGGNRISPDLADRPPVPQQADEATVAGFPASASLCGKCSAKAVVMMDGCATCLSCGNSKCG